MFALQLITEMYYTEGSFIIIQFRCMLELNLSCKISKMELITLALL